MLQKGYHKVVKMKRLKGLTFFDTLTEIIIWKTAIRLVFELKIPYRFSW